MSDPKQDLRRLRLLEDLRFLQTHLDDVAPPGALRRLAVALTFDPDATPAVRQEILRRRFAQSDFLTKWRLAKPNLSEAKAVLSASWNGALESREFKKEISAMTVDLIIFTIKRRELEAVLAAFGLPNDTPPSRYLGRFPVWPATVSRRRPPAGASTTLNAIVTLIGESGTRNASEACSILAQEYLSDMHVLIGMAAGVAGEVSLGDVVAASHVIDWEKQRLTPEGAKKQPVQHECERRVDLEQLELPDDWESYGASATKELTTYSKPEGFDPNRPPKYHKKVILSGDKLLEDGKLPELRESYHDNVRAYEMESAGFIPICRALGREWLVFRGIADFAPEQGREKAWQAWASLNAALVLRHYLESVYWTRKERGTADVEF